MNKNWTVDGCWWFNGWLFWWLVFGWWLFLFFCLPATSQCTCFLQLLVDLQKWRTSTGMQLRVDFPKRTCDRRSASVGNGRAESLSSHIITRPWAASVWMASPRARRRSFFLRVWSVLITQKKHQGSTSTCWMTKIECSTSNPNHSLVIDYIGGSFNPSKKNRCQIGSFPQNRRWNGEH